MRARLSASEDTRRRQGAIQKVKWRREHVSCTKEPMTAGFSSTATHRNSSRRSNREARADFEIWEMGRKHATGPD